VDASGAVEGYCGLAVDAAGKSRIGYRRSDTSALWQAGPERAPNWVISQVDSKEDAGRFASLVARPAGRIACAYYNFHENAGYGDVRTAQLAPGSHWEFAPVVETAGKSAADGVFTSLSVWSDPISGMDAWHVAFRAPEYGAAYHASTDSVIFAIEVVSDAEDPQAVPRTHELYANYPNPFNPTTTIRFDLPEPGDVTMRVYDASGRLIRTVLHEVKVAGRYQAIWDGRDEHGRRVSSGVYFYRIEAGSFSQAKRMVLVK